MVLANIFRPLTDIFGPVVVLFHSIIRGSWGWSITALTVVVRALLLPLAFKQMQSMHKPQRVTPQMRAICLTTVPVTLLVSRRSPQPQPVIATEASPNGEFAEVRSMSELLQCQVQKRVWAAVRLCRISMVRCTSTCRAPQVAGRPSARCK